MINRAFVSNGLPSSPRDVRELTILDGVPEAVENLKRANLEVVVITNQPDIARSKMSIDSVEEMHEEIRRRTGIENFYTCPHDDEDHCKCRKPRTGLLLKASQDLGLNLSRSFLVGDRWKDIQAGHSAGCYQCFFIDYGYNEVTPNSPFFVVSSLLEASRQILEVVSEH